jgi:hypothetical protein
MLHYTVEHEYYVGMYGSLQSYKGRNDVIESLPPRMPIMWHNGQLLGGLDFVLGMIHR